MFGVALFCAIVFMSKVASKSYTFDQRIILKALAATPANPSTGYTTIYAKDKDVNNQGIFAKIKLANTITEVELGVADEVLSATELSDVTITTPANRHVMIYDSATSQFVNRLLVSADLPAGTGGGGDVYLANANVFTAPQKISVDNGVQMTFFRPVNTGGFGAGFYYNFNNSATSEVTYGNQYVSIEDNTAGSHRGDFNVQLAIAASLGIRFRVYTAGNGGLIFGNNQRIQIDEGGLTAGRVFTLPDATTQLIGTTDTATVSNKRMSGIRFARTTITATTYTATDTDVIIYADSTSNNITITLPAASGRDGKFYIIHRRVATNTVTIDPNASETINGSATLALAATANASAWIWTDGTSWYSK